MDAPFLCVCVCDERAWTRERGRTPKIHSFTDSAPAFTVRRTSPFDPSKLVGLSTRGLFVIVATRSAQFGGGRSIDPTE
jgi:hypothetical protein